MATDHAPPSTTDRLQLAATALDGLAARIRCDAPRPSDVGALVAQVRRIQRLCDGVIATLGAVAEEHAVAGSGDPVEIVLSARDKASRATVTRDLRRVRVMARFGEVAASIRTGTARPANVDHLARALTRLTVAEAEALRRSDALLAERIATAKPAAFAKSLHRLIDRIRGDHGQTTAQRERADAIGAISPRPDGAGFVLHAVWETERGTAVHAAVNREIKELVDELGRHHSWTPAQLGAQAIHDLILRGASSERRHGSHRPHVVINVLCDRDTLAAGAHRESVIETFDGHRISPDQLDRMCCDAVLRRLDTAADGDVQAALTVRTPTAAQRAALRALYDGCAISGAPWSRCEIHHVVYYSESQRTVLSELVPLSRRWHHLVHDDRWRLQMDSDRTLRVFRPDGTHHTTVPPPVPVNQRRHQPAA